MPPRKALPPSVPAVPAKVEVDLFPSYEAALASSAENKPWAEQVLAVTQIDGAQQEAWAAQVGSEIQRKLKAEEAQLKAALAPVAQLEATIRGYHRDTIAQLKACKTHLAALLDDARKRAYAAAAQLMAHAPSEAERAQALAVVAPKPANYVEREVWSWTIAEGGLPTPEVRPDGTVALVFSRSSIPPDYFVLDGARLDREAAEGKASTSIPGIAVTREVKGHFRS